jgi:hypothetical protein
MQRNQLATKQVLARRNALGDSDGLNAFVSDQAVDAPFCAVEGVLGDLFVASAPHATNHLYRPRKVYGDDEKRKE